MIDQAFNHQDLNLQLGIGRCESWPENPLQSPTLQAAASGTGPAFLQQPAPPPATGAMNTSFPLPSGAAFDPAAHNPAAGTLQQLLQQCMFQQQQQQAVAQTNEVLVNYLLSLLQPAGAAAQPNWHPGFPQQHMMPSHGLQGPADWQQGPNNMNSMFDHGPAAAAVEGPACSSGVFSYPMGDWQQQQQQQQQAVGAGMVPHHPPGIMLPGSSRGLEMSATEIQLQLLLQGCQLPVGGFNNAYPMAAPGSALSTGLNPAAYASYTSSTAKAPRAVAAQQQFYSSSSSSSNSSQSFVSPLELSVASLSLQDRPGCGTSSGGSSPSRQSSLTSSSWGGSSGSVSSSSASFVLDASQIACSTASSSDDEDSAPVVPNHFCRQEISPALNASVTVLLNALRNLQYGGENPYPQQHRLYVCGLRESCKAIKAGRAKAVLLAPDIQLNKFGKPDRVLDSKMSEIIQSCSRPRAGCAPVPVVFALSRKKIGQVFGSKKRMSAIALLDVGGVFDLFNIMLQLAQEGRQMWAEMHP